MFSGKNHQPFDGQLDFLGGLHRLSDENSKISSFQKLNQEPLESTTDMTMDSPPGILLIIDTETTGLDPQTDQCLEVGAILFDVLSRSVLAQQSFLLPVSSNSAEAINHIPASITRLKQPWKEGLIYLEQLINSSEILVAHNAAFDRKWFGKSPLPEVSKQWLCTMEDIAWPASKQLKARPSVRDLALAYEIPVWSAHRALTDCVYLAEVFRRCDDLETLILQGLEPRKLMRAQVSYEQRDLAKKAGFTWNDPVPGSWTRRLSEREIQKLKFPVMPVERTE